MKGFKIISIVIGLFLNSFAWGNPSEQRVRDFAKSWYASFDKNAPVEHFLENLEEHNLEIRLPEAMFLSDRSGTLKIKTYLVELDNTPKSEVLMIKSIKN